MPLDLRLARPADAPLLDRWDREVAAWEHDAGDPWRWDVEVARVLPWREFLVAELDGRPIGFLQVIDPREEESHYWGEVPAGLRAIDIWIGAEADRNRGHGTEMMRQAIARCFADPAVTAVVIDPLETNTSSIRFYQRLGFRFVERRTFGEDDCAVHRFDRADWRG